VESEKELQCESIRSLKNSPRSYASEKCRALLYCNEPCGASAYGSEEQVMSITREELTAHWKDLLSNLRLDAFFVGRDEKYLISALSQCLLPEMKGFCKASKGDDGLYRVFVEPKKETLYAEDTLPVSQGQLLLAYRTGATLTDEGFYACTLLNEILGASPISKLFMNVREKQSLCYHCSSRIYTKGVMMVTSGIKVSNYEKAKNEILFQLEEIKKGNITEEEITSAKKRLRNAFLSISDSADSLHSHYSAAEVFGSSDSPLDLIEKTERVTREQIIEAAKKVQLDTEYFLCGTEGK
jgi:predicted Zn-dependent peptidase